MLAWRRTAAFLILSGFAVTGCGDDDGDTKNGDGVGTPDLPALADEIAVPIVFVHGFAGSAQQYQSQAARFAMNGYSAHRIRAYEHDGEGRDQPALDSYTAGTDAMIDAVRTEFNVKKVYLVGHSRGTFVSANYLKEPTRAAKVAKYISLDGVGCADAQAANVPCLALTQQSPELVGQKHVEVATSAESFKLQYNFFVGSEPKLVDIVRQPGKVKISGRAVNFPANTGRAGTTLDIWEVDGKTGARVGSAPVATFSIGADGAWGPVELDAEKYYEKNLYVAGANRQQHFYAQRYLRNSQFVRLLSGDPNTSNTIVNTNSNDNHSAVITLRMREWLTSDILNVSTVSKGRGTQAPVNAITSTLGGNANFPPISIHLHDAAASPADSSLTPLPWFSTQPFQTGVDVFMPAGNPPDGTITLTNMPRGDTSRPQTLNVANWPSGNNLVMAMFSDFAQD
jgi:pimeloyl-ACP methyl ester carboxylesterase